jgi:hypothetical protein
MVAGVTKHSGRFQNAPARPGASKQRTGQQTAQRTTRPVSNGHLGSQPATATNGPILQARQDAATAEADVVTISRIHLRRLMASSPRVRIAHLTDPELTPADRTELENSVRSALPRSAPVNSTPSALLGYLRQLSRAYRYKCVVTIVLLTAGSLLAATAWHNTGERMVVSSYTWIIDWRLPDGSVWHGAWKAGLPVIAMRPHNGRVVLRYWWNGRGYVTTEVDESWLIRNSFD